MDRHRLNSLQLTLLPGRPNREFSHWHTHDQAFLYWKDFWHKVFSKNGCPEDLDLDTFMRQDIISVLNSGNQIVGIFLHTFYNLLSPAFASSFYFSSRFPQEFLSMVSGRRGRWAMSMEYLTIDARWRKAHVGLSLGSLYISLAMKILEAMEYDVAIASSRSDVGVTQMLTDHGGEIFIAGVPLHNTPCDLVAMFRENIKENPHHETRHLADSLWQKRTDHSYQNLSSGTGTWPKAA